MNAEKIGADFVAAYERCWAEGAASVAQLYAPQAILVGYAIADGRAAIEGLLAGIIAQGWTRTEIKVVKARAIEAGMLVACEYAAIGSGAMAGRRLDAKSSHILVCIDDSWLTAMHTAT
jgi:ketosteroid isomerase-like protein